MPFEMEGNVISFMNSSIILKGIVCWGKSYSIRKTISYASSAKSHYTLWTHGFPTEITNTRDPVETICFKGTGFRSKRKNKTILIKSVSQFQTQ